MSLNRQFGLCRFLFAVALCALAANFFVRWSDGTLYSIVAAAAVPASLVAAWLSLFGTRTKVLLGWCATFAAMLFGFGLIGGLLCLMGLCLGSH